MWNPTLQISDRDLLLLLSYINILILFIQALYLSETESLLYHQEMQFFFHSYVWKTSFTSALKCTSVQAALIGCTCSVTPFEIYLAYKQKLFKKGFIQLYSWACKFIWVQKSEVHNYRAQSYNRCASAQRCLNANQPQWRNCIAVMLLSSVQSQ